jgi:hypothetical protein
MRVEANCPIFSVMPLRVNVPDTRLHPPDPLTRPLLRSNWICASPPGVMGSSPSLREAPHRAFDGFVQADAAPAAGQGGQQRRRGKHGERNVAGEGTHGQSFLLNLQQDEIGRHRMRRGLARQ